MTKEIYYICKYTPLEILEGFGFECKKFSNEYSNFDCAEACTHPNMCGYGKSVLEEVLKKNVKNLILVNCCDVCLRIFDVLKEQNNMEFLFLLNLPHKNDPASIDLFKSELKRLIKELKDFGNFDFEKIKNKLLLNFSDFNQNREEHVALLGAHSSTHLVNSVKKYSPFPVYDYTCGNFRNLNFDNINESNFIEAYSDCILNQKHPCSRMQFKDKTYITDKTRGIIYNNIKFCDYWGIEQRELKNRSIPVLNIETDCTAQSQGQLSTRLGAFFESLKPDLVKTKKNGKYYAGIDIGSTSTKAVILDNKQSIIASAIIDTGFGASNAANKVLKIILNQAGISENDLNDIITTGYGRNSTNLSAGSITEISCHAKGAHYLYSKARTVIDIGGQDLKVISTDENGNVKNFVMNDKCAAGTGRFLEVMAKTLKMDINEMSECENRWKNEIEISSMCTVFAESEVVSLISNNVSPQDIVHGLNMSVASKIYSLIKRLNCEPDFIMTGGVSKNKGVVNAIQTKSGHKIFTFKDSQLCGAIGAALFGMN